MLGQRLSNEQSNVGPTKYVAVGPTLNQRLGFGWRMVSVLAGMVMFERNEDNSQMSRVYFNLIELQNIAGSRLRGRNYLTDAQKSVECQKVNR